MFLDALRNWRCDGEVAQVPCEGPSLAQRGGRIEHHDIGEALETRLVAVRAVPETVPSFD